MKYKKQPYKSKQCGQACLAMILDKTVKEVCKELNKYKTTSLYDDVAAMLEKSGYKVTKHEGVVPLSDIPNNSVIRIKFPSDNFHFAVKYGDKYYDPAIGVVSEYNDYRKITHYINYSKND